METQPCNDTIGSKARGDGDGGGNGWVGGQAGRQAGTSGVSGEPGTRH